MESLTENVCYCSLDKIKTLYKPSDLDKVGDKNVANGITNAMKECMGM